MRLLFWSVLVFATRLLQAEPGMSAAGEFPLQLRDGMPWAELSIPQTTTGLRSGNHQLNTVPTEFHRKAILRGGSGLLGAGVMVQFGVVSNDAKSGRLFLGSCSARKSFFPPEVILCQ
ncbi:MAG: hypothetical protein AB7J34_17395 [Limisphaerales bacterium]